MTQTNTTQNKAELKDWKDQFRIIEGSRWTFPSEVRISWEALKELVDKSISQAHQSGIEEGKKAERNEIYRILSEELSVAYPDPRTGFRDMIEMEVEDLINQIDKSLKENK